MKRSCQEQNSVTGSEILRHDPGWKTVLCCKLLPAAPCTRSHQAAASHPLLASITAAPGRTPGLGASTELALNLEKRERWWGRVRRLPQEAGRPPLGSILNSQECVTTPQPGRGVPVPWLQAGYWHCALTTCFYFYDHTPTLPFPNAYNVKPFSLPRKQDHILLEPNWQSYDKLSHLIFFFFLLF